jgi:RNA polymerase sigma-70 factor (ECF subfamily)
MSAVRTLGSRRIFYAWKWARCPPLAAGADEAQTAAHADAVFPDERLKLLFVCAHPAIDAAVRTPLMLQTVLRLDAQRIASAFLVKPATMGQRLSHAEAKIRDTGIRFGLPNPTDLPPRLDAVLGGDLRWARGASSHAPRADPGG